VHEEKDTLDWAERFARLERLVAPYRSRSGRFHDCVVPVSGAGDSYFIVDVVRNRLRMNPLLVSYNQQYNTRTGIRNLAYLRTFFDCDYFQQTVSPASVKKVTRATLRLMGSMHWHCIAGGTAFPVQVATRFKIPLIIWGAHQGLEQVGMFSHLDEVEMSRRYRHEHDLMGYEAEDLLAADAGLSERDVAPYMYPHECDVAGAGVRGIYLGNYIRWDTKAQHEAMIDRYGYETAPQQRTFDAYNHVDNWHYAGVHDLIKYLKFGYSKVVDHVCREIRFGRLSREKGLGVVRAYQQVVPGDLPLLLEWLDMSEADFFACIDAHRDPAAWEKRDGVWVCRSELYAGGDTAGGVPPACGYADDSSRCGAQAETGGYTLMGRGWVDAWHRNP
jgi:N-acetyl sugar amidotransferase